MVSKLKDYVTAGEKAENDIRRCKETTGLSLSEMEKAWKRVKKLPPGRVIDKETRVPIQKLKECEALVGEAKKTTAAIAQEIGISLSALKKIVTVIERGREKGREGKEKTGGGKPASGCQHSQKVYKPRIAISGSYPGREYRSDESR